MSGPEKPRYLWSLPAVGARTMRWGELARVQQGLAQARWLALQTLGVLVAGGVYLGADASPLRTLLVTLPVVTATTTRGRTMALNQGARLVLALLACEGASWAVVVLAGLFVPEVPARARAMQLAVLALARHRALRADLRARTVDVFAGVRTPAGLTPSLRRALAGEWLFSPTEPDARAAGAQTVGVAVLPRSKLAVRPHAPLRFVRPHVVAAVPTRCAVLPLGNAHVRRRLTSAEQDELRAHARALQLPHAPAISLTCMHAACWVHVGTAPGWLAFVGLWVSGSAALVGVAVVWKRWHAARQLEQDAAFAWVWSPAATNEQCLPRSSLAWVSDGEPAAWRMQGSL